jgi:phospholipid transport system substrate-binding protein
MSFAYGLGASKSEPCLAQSSGQVFQLSGNDPVLVNARQPAPAKFLTTAPIAPAPVAAPQMVPSVVTLVAIAKLEQGRNGRTNGTGKITDPVEPTLLPLLNFRHMTQLALARHWRLASAEQPNVLVAEFKMLLARTYSTALANDRDQAIRYKVFRVAPGENEATLESAVERRGAERMTVDYDMEKTVAGWKIYDIKIAGISLIASYRWTFARAIRAGGLGGLINSLSARNRLGDPELGSHERTAQPLLFMYAVISSISRRSP